jgi:thiol-disulfide isomerase/thioredoxin
MAPRLVAVQIHADWCARSPEVAPVFADLLTQYGNEPVLFVTLDITDDVHREQARLLSATLGIPQAFDEPFESGMIKLIDRENRTVLASITGREEVEELELRIAELLDRSNENDRDGGGA